MTVIAFGLLIWLTSVEGADSCGKRDVTVVGRLNCSYEMSMMVPFEVLKITPSQDSCDASKTVCVRANIRGSNVSFYGHYPLTIPTITLSSVNTDFAEVIVIPREANEGSSNPLLLVFPVSGSIAIGSEVRIKVGFDNPVVTATADLVKTNIGTDCGKLCFDVTGRVITFWGAKQNSDPIAVTTNPTGMFVNIPQTQMKANQQHAYPPAITVPASKIISLGDEQTVTVDFKVTTIAPSTLVTGAACDDPSKKSCYMLSISSVADFVGRAFTLPLTFELKGADVEQIFRVNLINFGLNKKTSLGLLMVTIFVTVCSVNW